MWGRTHTDVRERVDQVAEVDHGDPFADLQPVEKLKRAALVEHAGSVHQVTEPEPEAEPREQSENAKYWAKPGLNLRVARRCVAMVVMLSLFSAGSGGMIVAVHLGQLIG